MVKSTNTGTLQSFSKWDYLLAVTATPICRPDVEWGCEQEFHLTCSLGKQAWRISYRERLVSGSRGMPASCSTVAKNRFSLQRRPLHLCLSQISQENELSLDILMLDESKDFCFFLSLRS